MESATTTPSTCRRLLLNAALLYIVVFAAVDGSPASRSACGSAVGTPRKEVVCYYEGKRAVSTVDACLCTHIIYTDIGMDQDSKLDIGEGAVSDLSYLRKSNPSVRLIASLGGRSVKSGVFSGLISDGDRLFNLTTSVNALYRDGVIDGVEIDWEWPIGSAGDKKDRAKLVRYARQIKIAVGAALVTHRTSDLVKRDAGDDDYEEYEEEEEG
jgi:hypothetical protein